MSESAEEWRATTLKKALDRAPRLHVRIEQVAGDQEEVRALRQGQVDCGPERRELPFPLRGRLLAEIVMPRTEMDVRGMDDPQHQAAAGLPVGT